MREKTGMDADGNTYIPDWSEPIPLRQKARGMEGRYKPYPPCHWVKGLIDEGWISAEVWNSGNSSGLHLIYRPRHLYELAIQYHYDRRYLIQTPTPGI
jgi:hypothetical protein